MTKEYTIQHEIELIREKIDELQSDLIALETLVKKAQVYPQLLEDKIEVKIE
jgi:hypothetical protein